MLCQHAYFGRIAYTYSSTPSESHSFLGYGFYVPDTNAPYPWTYQLAHCNPSLAEKVNLGRPTLRSFLVVRPPSLN